MPNAIPYNRTVKAMPKPQPPKSLFQRLITVQDRTSRTLSGKWTAPSSVKPVHEVTTLMARQQQRKAAVRSFLEACTQNKANVVATYIEEGVSPDTCHDDGISALHKAVEHGHLELVQVLLDGGAQVDIGVKMPDGGSTTARNWTCGDTPLHRACASGHLEVARCLVEAKADIQKRNGNAQLPVHYAARSGELSILQDLVTSGAEINFSDSSKRHVLHEAAAGGHLKVCEWLCVRMKKRVMKQVDRWGKSPLHLASYYGHLPIVQYLVEMWGADPFVKDFKGQTAAASTVHIPRSASRVEFSPERESDAPSQPASRPTSAMSAATATGAEKMEPLLPTPQRGNPASLPGKRVKPQRGAGSQQRRQPPPAWVTAKLDALDPPGVDPPGGKEPIQQAAEGRQHGQARPLSRMSRFSVGLDDEPPGQTLVASFLEERVNAMKSGQDSAGLKKTLGPGVNMSNVPQSIITHQRKLAMMQELQEALDAEAHFRGCLQAVKQARTAKQAKLKDIRDSELNLVHSHEVLEKEVKEAKIAVGSKMVLSRIPQSRLNSYSKMAAQCRSILNIQ